MVNTKDFTERLHQMMSYYDLSAASFADKIDVGRSSISHLLSGRNKPSLDFVMKIIEAFPEVELYWLLNGKGHFPRQSSPKKKESMETKTVVQDLFSEIALEKEKSRSKEIRKIVIFYDDGSFEAYEG